MRTEEFISFLLEKNKDSEGLKRLQQSVPLGFDAVDNVVYSQKRESPFTVSHTCVTGARKTVFLKRLLLTLVSLYDKTEANFLIASPNDEYGEFLRLQGADVTVPYVKDRTDLLKIKDCVREIIQLQSRGQGCPKLILLLDGLDEIDGCNKNGDLEEYREFFELLARRTQVEIISGANLMKSIFSGHQRKWRGSLSGSVGRRRRYACRHQFRFGFRGENLSGRRQWRLR